MPEFRIRAGHDDDAVAIAQAHIDARREAMPWLPVIHSFEETVRFFGDFVIPNQAVLVAENEAGVVAFIAIEGEFVEHLYVAPAHQGIGIGDALLARAKEMRPEGLMLWTFEGNHRARAFYEKRGFVAVEFTDGSRNEERTPDVRYQWTPA
ncbi:MAG TPA: GNAT family N-acetyltransferase [Candidatus Binataceae bacterium]|nr:GNAT family N-acetyltransferase [Candidatus Binataceae bacterium]